MFSVSDGNSAALSNLFARKFSGRVVSLYCVRPNAEGFGKNVFTKLEKISSFCCAASARCDDEAVGN